MKPIYLNECKMSFNGGVPQTRGDWDRQWCCYVGVCPRTENVVDTDVPSIRWHHAYPKYIGW